MSTIQTRSNELSSRENAELKSASVPLSGWGRYPVVKGKVCRPNTTRELLYDMQALDAGEGLLCRGLGRSYGDAAISADSRVLVTSKLDRFLSFDSQNGIVRCEPGVSFAEIIRTFLPKGWFPAVTPGTKHVTMGGALASDIHGKNHHYEGSFIDFVKSFSLITADNQAVECSREKNSQLFWASAGGMGLTGIVSEIELQLRAVENQFIVLKRISCAGLAATFKAIEDNEKGYPYSVSWIDCVAGGSALGRSILILGRHANKTDLKDSGEALNYTDPKQKVKVPLDLPSWLLNRYSIGAFNSLYYHVFGGDGQEKLSHYEPFFYPLDAVLDWNRLYGKSGFIQYQCALPLDTSKAGMEEIVSLCSKRGRSSFLAVLKKFGAGHRLLSFPIEGYTLALDIPVKDGLFEFTRELDELVLKYGGRIYLAKDSCVDAESFAKMYEDDLPKWKEIKRGVDPTNLFRSAQSERLKLY